MTHTIAKPINSKLNALCEFVKIAKNRPLIVFAQWSNVICALFDMFNSIAPTYILRGNTLQRQSTLLRFKQTNGILLLNIHNSFAGIHTPWVKNIIFAHVLVGDMYEMQALQQQAIARSLRIGNLSKEVNVLFFVAQDCAEEREWNKINRNVAEIN